MVFVAGGTILIMEEQEKILIADNDKSAAQLTAFYLTQAMYETKIVSDVRQLRTSCEIFSPNLILMETVFTGTEKFQAFRDLHSILDVPVIFLSSDTDTADKVQGLNLGADDYLVKPCDERELLAHIRAVLRRCSSKKQPSSGTESGDCVSFPDLEINRANYSVIYKGELMNIPPKELELLYTLAASPNRVFSREQLLEQLWGYDYMGDTRTVDVHIKRLREKFKANEYWEIVTVWGVGYKFEVKK